MARLSQAVYDYRHETHDETVCDQMNQNTFPNNNNNTTTHADWVCHWYHHHEWYHGGIQVMLVDSAVHNHITVVFAGTDDVSTMLLDTDSRYTAFGDGANWTLGRKQPPPNTSPTNHDDSSDDNVYRDVRVHAGFNYEVFGNGIMDLVWEQLTRLRQTYPARRVFVTGHSLGAAAAILTSMALVEYYDHPPPATPTQQNPLLQHHHWWDPSSWWKNKHKKKKHLPPPPPEHVYTINFGCPRVGNAVYRTYFPHPRLHVWRVVLGWDLVPRLPDFFWHAGHTVQISEPAPSDDPADDNVQEIRNVTAYYEHYGNDTLGYAGVPSGWAARPYIWVPGALESHHIANYLQVLQNWTSPWVTDFARVEPHNETNYDDDDAYVKPPLDDFPLPEKE